MLADFLVESRCPNGHTSSLAFRGYRRNFVDEVVDLLVDECAWPICDDGTTCRADLRHEVHELGAADVDEETRRAAWRASTVPAMRAVHDLPGPRSSRPPPSLIEEPPPSGGFVAGEE